MPENYLNDVKYKQIGNCSGIVKQTMMLGFPPDKRETT